MRVAPRARTRRVAALPVLAALLIGPAGCARRGPGPPPPPPAARRAVPGYERLADSLAAVDTRGIAGRRIALDPGHGGFFRGALGVNGLTEAEVNLAVALKLRDLLTAHGAAVLLTRDRNRDFLSPGDSALRTDLLERARLANAFGPDLFVSIHHNADAAGTHDVNETQTYYKLGDDGPSLDVAQDVHRALVRNVGIRPHKVVPGNYLVLRASEAPALLTETSYITFPEVEARLRLPEKQQLEAEALFIGLARYFSRPVPAVATLEAFDPGAPGEDSVFTRGDPRIRARVQGEFDHAELEVDGRLERPERSLDRLAWRPERPWSPGEHEVRLSVRLSGVGSARDRRLRFTVAPVTARLGAALWPGAPDPQGGTVALRVELRSARGVLTRDSSRVVIRSLPRGAFVPAETVVVARDGVAWSYLRARPPAPRARSRAAALRISMDAPSVRPETLRVAARRGGPAAPATWAGFIRDAESDAPLRDAPGTHEPDRAVGWLNRDGFAVLERDQDGSIVVPRLAGYRRATDADGGVPRVIAVANGVLHGRRITLDPEGGGEDPAGVGEGGTRAAHLNLETARILAGFLTAAGAEVHLTRAGDFAVPEVERVRGSEDFRAERYLRIGHRARRFGYYFSSPAGRRWAAATAAQFAALGLPSPPTAEDAAYPLQQTSCPALYASPARVDSGPDEQALLAPGALRAEAYALFLAVTGEWAPGAAWPLDSLEVRDQDGAPVPGALVTLGDALVLESDALGRIRFARTETGPLGATVSEQRVRARTLLLDSMRGAVLTGPRGD